MGGSTCSGLLKKEEKRAVETGFFDTEWFGRFTCISERPVFLVDERTMKMRQKDCGINRSVFPGKEAYLHNGCVSR